jgi:hypothetical protein
MRSSNSEAYKQRMARQGAAIMQEAFPRAENGNAGWQAGAGGLPNRAKS